MGETREGSITVGVPDELERKFKTKRNCLYREEESFSLGYIIKKIQPLLRIEKDRDGIYDIAFFMEGEGLEVKTEHLNLYPASLDYHNSNNPFVRTI